MIPVFLATTFGVASVPFDLLIPWAVRYFRRIDSKMDKPYLAVTFSKLPLLVGLGMIINFFKGYIPVWVAIFYFEEEWITLVAVCLAVIGSNWSVFLGFKNQRQFGMVLWGVYTAVFPIMGLVYPVLVGGWTFLTNSLAFGFGLTVLSFFVVVWVFLLDPYLFMLNFLIFLILFFGTSLYEGKKKNLLESYLGRLED